MIYGRFLFYSFNFSVSLKLFKNISKKTFGFNNMEVMSNHDRRGVSRALGRKTLLGSGDERMGD